MYLPGPFTLRLSSSSKLQEKDACLIIEIPLDGLYHNGFASVPVAQCIKYSDFMQALEGTLRIELSQVSMMQILQ